ncbi:hypothetical protein BGZ76_006293 [Entomortierella beljakovae]|nr:hypothetical protein BGZ76_006293 [Entomortierella beljakovae]
MSSLYNRMYDEGLGLLGPRKQHQIRSRRISGRKHQLHRRDNLTAADLLYTLTNSESLLNLSPCTSSRSKFITDMLACAPTFPATTKHHHRADVMGCETEFSGRFHNLSSASSSEDASTLANVSIDSTAAFTGCHSQQLRQIQQEQEFEYLPLPPVVLRMHMPGSPLSPFPPQNEYGVEPEFECSKSILRPGYMFGGARTMGASGRSGASGGGGDNPVPTDGTNGGGDDGGAEGGESEGGKSVPSAYTFRRRNAIVEGSDEAPKSDDFPESA